MPHLPPSDDSKTNKVARTLEFHSNTTFENAIELKTIHSFERLCGNSHSTSDAFKNLPKYFVCVCVHTIVMGIAGHSNMLQVTSKMNCEWSPFMCMYESNLRAQLFVVVCIAFGSNSAFLSR